MKQEAEFVLPAAAGLARRISYEFWLYGVRDESEVRWILDPLRAQGVRLRSFPYMRYPDFLSSLENVAVGLHPVSSTSPFSLGKSFGKILAYLTADVAIVTSDENDHHRVFESGVHAVIARSVEAWIKGIHDLLREPERRERMADAARNRFLEHLSLPAAARKVSDALDSAIESST